MGGAESYHLFKTWGKSYIWKIKGLDLSNSIILIEKEYPCFISQKYIIKPMLIFPWSPTLRLNSWYFVKLPGLALSGSLPLRRSDSVRCNIFPNISSTCINYHREYYMSSHLRMLMFFWGAPVWVLVAPPNLAVLLCIRQGLKDMHEFLGF